MERHLSNPVNGYHVIKRMYESIQELDSLIDSDTNRGGNCQYQSPQHTSKPYCPDIGFK